MTIDYQQQLTTGVPVTPLASNPTHSNKWRRLLLTGAAGALGRVLRPRLKECCETLRLSDVTSVAEATAREEVVLAALEDRAAVHALVHGVDAIVHLGGAATEQRFEPILQANIVGAYNLYEAARVHGVKRVVFASSNHATGFYRQDEMIDSHSPVRPDGLYGVSKVFGESLSRFYFDRYGIETVCLRIGSCFPEPQDRRMLATWQSYNDLQRLVVASLEAPVVGHTIVYGVSDNASCFWDNRAAAHIGYWPQDSSERFHATIEAAHPTVDRSDPATMYQGGAFVRMGPFD